jgi:hypothetical protein
VELVANVDSGGVDVDSGSSDSTGAGAKILVSPIAPGAVLVAAADADVLSRGGVSEDSALSGQPFSRVA